MFFAQNVIETEQTTRLTDDFQQAAIEAGIPPLLLSIDQEGGKVVRLGTGTSLPGNMALGATGDEEMAYNYGDIIGKELESLGLNVNFAPVMDTNNNPNNPVIGERSISSNPELVGKLGVQIIAGLQDNGVSAAIKHFPGHGDTETDSHYGLPVVDKSKEEVENLELIPFKKAADEGVDFIMTAHIAYPQLEKDTAISKKDGSEINIPATLSDDILTSIIRDEMNFKGIVITDAMNMQAIADHFGQAEAALMSFKSGADIILMPTIMRSKENLKDLDAVYAKFEEALESGELSTEKLNTSVRRILELKEKRGILDLEQYKIPIEDRISNALQTVGSKQNLDKQREITQKSITVVKNENETLPIKPKNGEKVLLLAAYDNEAPALTYGYTLLQREGIIPENIEFNTVVFNKNTTAEEVAEIVDGYDYVIVISELISQANLNPSSWVTNVPDMVIEKVNSNGGIPVVLSVGKPYDAGRYPHAKAVVLAYGAKGMDPTEAGTDPVKTFGPNIPYSLDIIFGKVASIGKLPVDVPALNEDYTYSNEIEFPFGFGLETNIEQTKKIKGFLSSMANVRELPNGPIIGTALKGELIEGEHEEGSNWVKFDYYGKEAYVHKSLLIDEKEIKGFVKNNTNIRQKPNGKIVDLLEAGKYVEGTINVNNLNWVKINEGYIYKPLVVNTLDVEGLASSLVNIRQTPNGKIIGLLEIGEYVKGYVDTDNPNWIRISHNGKTGYVSRALISDKVKLRGIISTLSNVRQEPNGKIVGRLKLGDLVEGTVHLENRNWLKIRYNGKDAYVYRYLLEDKVQLSGKALSAINVRKSPNGTIIGTLKKGSQVKGEITVSNPNWIEIQYNG
ncbi:MAG: glycoside hydrolase family 3 N-terminal domain-containing protein, partial [Helcococcus sp.]|nr:glycoside hydrolase family 3 N-terminal domain-containing protein [Helcococcus sp.]